MTTAAESHQSDELEMMCTCEQSLELHSTTSHDPINIDMSMN